MWTSAVYVIFMMLGLSAGCGVPGFVRKHPALRASIAFGCVILVSASAFSASERLGIAVTLLYIGTIVITGRWVWRHFKKQRSTSGGFWSWLAIVSVPVVGLTTYTLSVFYKDFQAAEKRAAERAQELATTVIDQWTQTIENKSRAFFSSAAVIQSGTPVRSPFDPDILLSSPLPFEVSSTNILLAGPTPIPDWWTTLPADVRKLWSAIEQDSNDPARSAIAWERIRYVTSDPHAAAFAEFARIRASMRADIISNALETFLTNHIRFVGELSPSGIPLPHLFWREALRFKSPPFDTNFWTRQIQFDLNLAPDVLVLPLIDELERTWGTTGEVWKDLAAAERSRQLARVQRRRLEAAVHRSVTKSSRPTQFLRIDNREYLLRLLPLETAQPESTAKTALLLPPELWDKTLTSAFWTKAPEDFNYFTIRLTLGDRSYTIAGNTNSAVDSPRLGVAHGNHGDVAEIFFIDRRSYLAEARQRFALSATLTLGAAAIILLGVAISRRAYLRQQDLNEAQANFVSSVSHELRAPLASVRLLAENLERGGDESPERRREYYGLMVRECRRLGTLVQNVLDWSRIERGGQQYEFAPADLAALARETARLMEPQFTERNVRLELQITSDVQCPDGLEAVVDAASIQQALINLLDNALKHSPAGSVVSLSLAHTGGRLQFTVADQGPGIPVDEHERIFDRFHRLGSELRRETAGIGIGLSIVKHIAEVHGGYVRVFSTPGHGATFTLELPKHR